jgi:lactate dehydrogenase-like 2-hydroxyacid dehydrogenase
LYEYFNRYAGEKQIMSFNKPIHRIAIVGTGLIGSSWAALYLARGFDMIATNPHPNAESKLRHGVDLAWDDLTMIGLSPSATRDRLTFTPNMREALLEADFVQENGPEHQDFKLFAEMDNAAPPDSIIASSTSWMTMSAIQSEMDRQRPQAIESLESSRFARQPYQQEDNLIFVFLPVLLEYPFSYKRMQFRITHFPF